MASIKNEKLGAQITFRTTDGSYRLVEEVMRREWRKQNESIRMLLDIGLFAYMQAGKSFLEWQRDLEEWARAKDSGELEVAEFEANTRDTEEAQGKAAGKGARKSGTTRR